MRICISSGIVVGAFLSLPATPAYFAFPDDFHSSTNRAHMGIPSVEISSGGRLWATWYGGVTPAEDQNNYTVLSTSGDGGKSWKEVVVYDPDLAGEKRAFDPQVWISPDGKLRWTWTVRKGNDSKTDSLFMAVADDPEDERPSWCEPVEIARGVMMGKPIVLSCGDWLLPVCHWFEAPSSCFVASTDCGKTWQFRGGATMPRANRIFDEHCVVEKMDGTLWVLARMMTGIAESYSSDRGKTWTPMVPTWLPHCNARFFIRRLRSGNLVLVKHGPVRPEWGWHGYGRSRLMAFLSEDDGNTWLGGLMLDERNDVSYPDGTQANDGTIHIIYDYDRCGSREVLLASFTESDILSGKTDSPTVRLRQLVGKGSGGRSAKSTK